jgi:hypothetical protein
VRPDDAEDVLDPFRLERRSNGAAACHALHLISRSF